MFWKDMNTYIFKLGRLSVVITTCTYNFHRGRVPGGDSPRAWLYQLGFAARAPSAAACVGLRSSAKWEGLRPLAVVRCCLRGCMLRHCTYIFYVCCDCCPRHSPLPPRQWIRAEYTRITNQRLHSLAWNPSFPLCSCFCFVFYVPMCCD